MKPITVDVIVPSVRSDPRRIQSILSTSIPHEMDVTYYIVIDHPEKSPPDSIFPFYERENVKILRNGGNLGASAFKEQST